MARKSAVARITADTRDFDRGLSAAAKKWEKFGRGLRKGVAGAGGSLMGGVRGLAGVGGRGMAGMFGGLKTAVGLGGIGGLAVLAGNEANKTLKFESALVRLKIASQGAVSDLDALRTKAFAISDATGVAREDVLRGAAAYTTLTGDTKTAIGSMELFSKIAKGQGASMDDIAAAAAALNQSMKIQPDQFDQAFSVLIRGAKMGAVEIKDFAGLMAGLAPRMERFKGGTGVKAVAELGAAFQLTRQGFGDAEEAATGLESLMGSLVGHADKIKSKLKVNVFDVDAQGVMRMRSMRDIVQDIARSKVVRKGDLTTLQKVLGRKEAMQTLQMLTRIPGQWDEIAAATLAAKDVQEDFAEYGESTIGRLEKSFERLQNMIAKTFTPDRIDSFARALEASLKMAEDFSDWVETKGKKAEQKGLPPVGERPWYGGLLLPYYAAKGLLGYDDEEVAEQTAGLAEHYEGIGMSPDDVEKKTRGGKAVADAMRKRAAEKLERERDRIFEEGEVFASQADDPDAPTKTEAWAAEDEARKARARAAAASGAPGAVGHDPWREIKVSISASPEFQATVENAPSRRLRP